VARPVSGGFNHFGRQSSQSLVDVFSEHFVGPVKIKDERLKCFQLPQHVFRRRTAIPNTQNMQRCESDAEGVETRNRAPDLWRRHTAPSATDLLQLLDPDHKTVMHHTRKRWSYRTIDCGGR